MGLGFLNNIGLWALSAVVVLALFYIFRPRPKRISVPSLLFFLSQDKKKHKSSFFNKFFTNILFLLQVLLLALIALTVAEPFFELNESINSQNSVIVLDISASMLTREGSVNRFELAKDKVLERLTKENTLVLATETPRIVLVDASSSEVKEYLKSVQPIHSTTNLVESILTGGELLVGSEGKLIVVSDFLDSLGNDPTVVRAVLESKEIDVEFVQVGQSTKSVGFVGLNVGDELTSITIRNYNPEKVNVEISVNNEKSQLSIPANGIAAHTFNTVAGTSLLKLTVEKDKDTFLVDNELFVSTSPVSDINIGLITNDVSKFFPTALEAIPRLNIDILEPPILKLEGHDIYVIQNVDKDEFLHGTYEELEELVVSGKSLIIYAQSDLVSQKFYDQLPIEIDGLEKKSGVVQVVTPLSFLEDVTIGSVSYYLKTYAKNVTTVLEVNGYPALTLEKLGQGEIMYYGIFDESSDFKISPSYPIFWNNVFDYLMGIEDSSELNALSGTSKYLPTSSKIVFEDSVQESNFLYFSEVGFYTIGKDVIGVNLLNELESDIAPKEFTAQKASSGKVESITQKRKVDLGLWALLIAMVLLFLELWITRKRGEL